MFGHFVGSSKNVQNSIAICPESLISHLGIIKTLRNLQKSSKKPRKNNNTHKMFAVSWALFDPVLGREWPLRDNEYAEICHLV